MALINKLKAIADAIRTMTGKSEEMTLDAMPEEIKSIKTAKEPYVEETYDESGNLIGVKFVGNYTKIRDYFFGKCTYMNLENKDIPETITTIGQYAFHACASLTLDSIPETITDINYGAFQDCTKLRLNKLPDNLKGEIRGNTFKKCYEITIKEIPENILYIGSGAFLNCTGLTEMTFKSTPTSISSNAFEGCTNLTVINVPWSEGAVSNAPWGATNATINYDYVGE